MITNDLKHYYSIAIIHEGKTNKYRELGFINKFFTKSEAATCIIENKDNKFEDLTLTILEIFEQ